MFFLSCLWISATQSALGAAVYRKALQLRVVSNPGKIVNLVTNDAQRLHDCFLYFHFLWSGFFLFVGVSTLLAIKIGWVCAPGSYW
jgi:hypothetical protein